MQGLQQYTVQSEEDTVIAMQGLHVQQYSLNS